MNGLHRGPVPHEPACARPGKGVSRPVSRVLYGPDRDPAVAAIPLGRPLPAASSNQPGRRASGQACGASAAVAPIRSCSRWGLPCRPRRRVRGALLPHPFTLTAGQTRRRSAFCGTFPRAEAPPDVIRHRVPMEPGLSSPALAGAAARPADDADLILPARAVNRVRPREHPPSLNHRDTKLGRFSVRSGTFA